MSILPKCLWHCKKITDCKNAEEFINKYVEGYLVSAKLIDNCQQELDKDGYAFLPKFLNRLDRDIVFIT